MAQIIDGRAIGRSLNQALKARVPTLPRPPGLAVVLVGTDPASQIYVNLKGRVAERLGFHHRQLDLPETTSQGDLRGLIDTLNADEEIDGILVQLPLPGGLDAWDLVDRIDPGKDVDGLSDRNAGRLSQARPTLVPCTPMGIMHLLDHVGVAPKGLRACVVGRSNIVGRPMAQLLEHAHATVTVCHSRTRDLREIVQASDIVVAAVGSPELVRGAWIKEGAVVIDVGMNRLDDGSLVGDVEFEPAAERASAITPVPGGVGPMTIAMLMQNTFVASAARQGA